MVPPAPRCCLVLLLLGEVACRSSQPPADPTAVEPARRSGPDFGLAPDGGHLPTALRRARPEGDLGPAADGPCVVGVPECDEYLAKFYICVTQQVSAPQRETMEQALRSTCEALRQSALSPAGRPGLSQACLTALSAARQSMAAFGCTW